MHRQLTRIDCIRPAASFVAEASLSTAHIATPVHHTYIVPYIAPYMAGRGGAPGEQQPSRSIWLAMAAVIDGAVTVPRADPWPRPGNGGGRRQKNWPMQLSQPVPSTSPQQQPLPPRLASGVDVFWLPLTPIRFGRPSAPFASTTMQ
jgi:hypothetical protein